MASDKPGRSARDKHERRIINNENLMQVAHKRYDQLKAIVK